MYVKTSPSGWKSFAFSIQFFSFNYSLMKKIAFTFLAVMAFFSASAMEITVQSSGIQADSIYLYSYTSNYRWEKTYALPYSEKVVFKQKEYLSPGMYIISTDSLSIAFFVISDQKSQTFTIHFDNGELRYEGSPENTENQKYLQQMAEFEQQSKIMNAEYSAIVNGNEPMDVQENKVIQLSHRADMLDSAKRSYQFATAKELKGTLLASIIQGSAELNKPSQEVFSDRSKFEDYLLEHHFDNFPWDDSRILATPVAINKFRDFGYILSNVQKFKALLHLEKTLKKLKQYPESYTAFFEYMEKAFGDQNSPLFSQDIYLLMLNDALTLKNLPLDKKVRYEKTITRLDKNNMGDIAPDFPILLSHGDTTNLHAIKADYLILYIQNPDCPTCAEIREKMNSLADLNKGIDEKKIAVLTVYFEQNEELWRSYLAKSANPKYLHGWNFSKEIEEKELYDTQIIPYIYLLDAEKRILVKDMSVNELDEFLKTLKL